MERLDPKMKKLMQKLGDSSLNSTEKAAVEEEIKRREERLAGVYHQVAVKFAELHDTPVRMKEKGTIKEIVSWKGARRFLYWRLRRKLLETQLSRQIINGVKLENIKMTRTIPLFLAGTAVGHSQRSAMIRRWFTEDHRLAQTFAKTLLSNILTATRDISGRLRSGRWWTGWRGS